MQSDTLIMLPETRTVSTRLNTVDYRVFRSACNAMGFTMHRVLKTLVGYWLLSMAEQMNTRMPVSKQLRRKVERDMERQNIIPQAWQ